MKKQTNESEESIILVRRSDLIESAKNKQIQTILIYDIRGSSYTTEQLARAVIVIFIDDNGKRIAIKDRYDIFDHSMVCPYDKKIDACLYLERISPNNKEYFCGECPHYNPQEYYDKEPQHEGFSIAAVFISALTLLIVLGIYGVYQLIKLIISWL